jgi:hypothetical protein
MAYWYYAMCHNLKLLKIDNEDPLSIFKTKKSIFFHLPRVIM